jgi:hypothetical protein
VKAGLSSSSYTLKVNAAKIDVPESDPVFLLLKHEDYQLVYMPPAGNQRKVSLMVPKMKIFFCFFVNDEIKNHHNYETINLATEENIVTYDNKRHSSLSILIMSLM